MFYKQWAIPAVLCSSRLSCPSLDIFFLLLDLCAWAPGLHSAAGAGDCPDKKAH